MSRLLTINRKINVAVCCILLSLSAIAVGLTLRTNTQGAQGDAREEALKQVNESPDQLLRVVGNDDCPLRIVTAKVKEVPGALFTKLTGKTTDLVTISSAPEVTLLNTSGQTITKFMLIVREPKSRKTRGVIQHDVSVRPGETYVINRELFITPDKVMTADAKEQAQRTVVNPGIKSERGWIEFAARPDLFVTVGLINFEDGSSWTIKEGGEVR
ncbi:MAG TPA: hypothetical protein VHU19_04190 [Pyrinomonadaceae bacterium]|jgi:hypothetical protein|nr:hypothetical protein [Pyrinomonadaceae bacterium]